MKRRKGFYSISVVAKMFSVHQQTIRMYEKEGLISPKRTEGNTRLFSEEDVDRLEEVINLTHKMGVNIAGVQMILKLQKKIKKLQDEMNGLFEQVSGNLEQESDEYRRDIKKQGRKLLDIKEQSEKKIKKAGGPIDIDQEYSVDKSSKNEEKQNQDFDLGRSSASDESPDSDESFDDWEIEYEESD
ncbi:MerR family transcriptional regulator [Candidatus Dependentiae bacterium]